MSRTNKKARTSAEKRYAQIEQISVAGLPAGMGPLGLHFYAGAFLDAARSLPPPNDPFEPVRPFLVCHLIELALKAFLSLHGVAMVELAEVPMGTTWKQSCRGLTRSTWLPW